MAQNIGTLITSAIRPNDSLDPIASAYAVEVKGGHHTYATLAERDAIILERREWGMLCTIYNDGNGGYIDINGNTVDENGNIIINIYDDGNGGYIDINGNQVDKNGNKVDKK